MARPDPESDPLGLAFQRTVRFLDSRRVPYFLIGGLASSLIGEPRLTADVDVDVFIDAPDFKDFLAAARRAGFRFSAKTALSDLERVGACRLAFGGVHVDFIRASTELEREALRRSRRARLYGLQVVVPSPEDLILLKLVPGREQDLLDAHGVARRHSRTLDRRYLERWARTLSDDAEDLRIWNAVRRLLES